MNLVVLPPAADEFEDAVVYYDERHYWIARKRGLSQ